MLGLHCCVRAFSSWGAEPLVAVASLVMEHRLYSARASEIVGHGLFGVVQGLSCPHDMWDLSSLIRDWTLIPYTKRQILYHQTTREVPTTLYFGFCLCSLYVSWSLHLLLLWLSLCISAFSTTLASSVRIYVWTILSSPTSTVWQIRGSDNNY